MKILFLNATYNQGSTGRIVYNLGNMLSSNGHAHLSLYGRGASENHNSAIKFTNKLSVYFHVLMTRLFDLHGFCSKCDTKKLIKLIDDYNPDIIHLHNIHGYYINIIELFDYLKQNKKISVVWTLHDCWSFTGHCSHFDFIGCNNWQVVCSDCPQVNQYPKSFIDKSRRNFLAKKEIFAGIENITLVAVSNWLRSVVEKSFLSPYEVRTIYNGINCDVFKPTKTNLKEMLNVKDKKIILGVSNVWTERKGFQDFIALSEKINDDYQIIMIGLSDKQIKSLPSNIIGRPRTNSLSELVEYYSISDIYFNASVEESFGLTSLEALACGTPVILYDATAIPEIISKDSGIVVKKKDIDAVCNAILKIEKRPFSPIACRNQATLFDETLLYKDYLKLYEFMLNSKTETA